MPASLAARNWSEPMAAFIHNLEAAAKAREIWQPLLLIVALLFPLDVAIRRVILSRSDYQKAGAWLQARLPRQKRVGQRIRETDKQMGGLFAARERARGRQMRGKGGRENEQPDDLPESQSSSHPKSQPFDNTQETFSDEALSRLREAKRRARKDGK